AAEDALLLRAEERITAIDEVGATRIRISRNESGSRRNRGERLVVHEVEFEVRPDVVLQVEVGQEPGLVSVIFALHVDERLAVEQRRRGGPVRRTPGDETVSLYGEFRVGIGTAQGRQAVRVARAGTGTPDHVAGRIGYLLELALGEIPICAGHRVHVHVAQEACDVALVLGKVGANKYAEVPAVAILDTARQRCDAKLNQ